MKVGFIGLGRMGIGMVASLLRAGHEVTVYNRTPSKAQRLVEQVHRSPRTWRTPAGATPSSRCWRTTALSKASPSARRA